MKDRIRRLEIFNLYDYQGVEEHLSAMAAKGWRLEKANNSLWTYRRTAPAQVRYAVTYSPELSQFDPGPTEGQARLEDLCEAAGWEKVCDWLQMQIFSTEAKDPVPLETDEALRLENIHQTVKKHFYPANLVLLVLALVMIASWANSLVRTPIRVLGNNSRLFSGLMFLILVIMLLVNLGAYWLWRRRSLRSVEAGGNCVRLGPGYRRAAAVFLALVALLAVGYVLTSFWTAQGGYAVYFLTYIALFTLLTLAVHGTKNLLKRQGVSRGKNMAATLAVDFLLALVLVGGLTWAAVHFEWFTGGRGETYVYQNQEWDVHPADLPLTAAELTGRPVEHSSRNVWREGSVFLADRRYWETALVDGELYFLSYEIWEPRFAWLREALLEGILNERRPAAIPGMTRSYVPEDPAPWGAEAVWRRYLGESPSGTWLLAWPDRVAEVRLDNIPPTAAEMETAGRLLREG